MKAELGAELRRLLLSALPNLMSSACVVLCVLLLGLLGLLGELASSLFSFFVVFSACLHCFVLKVADFEGQKRAHRSRLAGVGANAASSRGLGMRAQDSGTEHRGKPVARSRPEDQ